MHFNSGGDRSIDNRRNNCNRCCYCWIRKPKRWNTNFLKRPKPKPTRYIRTLVRDDGRRRSGRRHISCGWHSSGPPNPWPELLLLLVPSSKQNFVCATKVWIQWRWRVGRDCCRKRRAAAARRREETSGRRGGEAREERVRSRRGHRHSCCCSATEGRNTVASQRQGIRVCAFL